MPNLFGFLLQDHILATFTEKASQQINGHTCHIVVMSWTKQNEVTLILFYTIVFSEIHKDNNIISDGSKVKI
jgi:hypothetical protein